MKDDTEGLLSILDMIGRGHSYEQILQATPAISYLDIFAAARLAAKLIRGPQNEYAERLARIRRQYPRAYEKWSAEEDQALGRLVSEKHDRQEIAELLQRQASAIRSRMVKLGIIQP